MITPPSFPARPVNGGPLPKAQPKHGENIWEPKVNGWRAWTHVPTGAMFNRRNEPLSISAEFQPVLTELREWWEAKPADGTRVCFEWLDTEAFERRHNFGRGSLVILDAPLVPEALTERQQAVYDYLIDHGPAKSWPFLHEPPPQNQLLSFAYSFTDYGITPPPETDWLADENHYRGEDIDGIHTGWRLLQEANRKLGCKPGSDLFEGMVAKRADSRYPLQLRSPEADFPFWMKHRWQF